MDTLIKAKLVIDGTGSEPKRDSFLLIKDEDIDIANACLFVSKQSENCLIKEMDIVPMNETIEAITK